MALYHQDGSITEFINSVTDMLHLHYEQHAENRELIHDFILAERQAKI